MHIVHLALGVDCMSSVLLDLTDDGMNLIAGTNRDQRLKHVWDSLQGVVRRHQWLWLYFFLTDDHGRKRKKTSFECFWAYVRVLQTRVKT